MQLLPYVRNLIIGLILEGFISPLRKWKISSKNRVIMIIYNINEIKKGILYNYQRYLWWLLAAATPVVSPCLAYGCVGRYGSGAAGAVSIRKPRFLLRFLSGKELWAD
jgi:hypothetical protein